MTAWFISPRLKSEANNTMRGANEKIDSECNVNNSGNMSNAFSFRNPISRKNKRGTDPVFLERLLNTWKWDESLPTVM